ncbi:MAG: GNAT family N-acetyltransferase [Fimbriimonadaceae bacterium]|nr:GNAT family N-acetyltransferase [Fimbriimonadaceae bacterium]
MTPQLVMQRDRLADLPPLPLAGEAVVRCWRPGDEAAWVRLINESFEQRSDVGYFDRRLRDGQFRPARVWFATVAGEPLATASAWFVPAWGAAVGALHMVGAASTGRGRGLGRLACLAALHQLAAEGRQTAVLSTDDFRLPAIRCYLGLGFIPRIVHDNQPDRWRAVLAALGEPEWCERLAEQFTSAPRPLTAAPYPSERAGR